jgi:hypothetical protein
MAATPTPNLALNHKWNFRESGWHTGMDENLVRIGALLHAAALDKDLTAPPGAPTAGDRYLIAAGASGAWAGHDGEFTLWDGAAWLFETPAEGWLVWVSDENLLYAYTGAAWAEFSAAAGGPYLPLAGGTLTGTLNSRSIVPTASATYPLGGSSNRWSIVYGNALNLDAVAAAAIAVLLSAVDGGDVYARILNSAAAGSTDETASLILEPGPSSGAAVAPCVQAYRIGTGADAATRDYGLRLCVTNNNTRVVAVVVDNAGNATLNQNLTVNGGFQAGDADGDDAFLRGLGRGLLDGDRWSIAASNTAGDYTYVAPGAGSLILAHGQVDYTSPGNPIKITKNGSDWLEIEGTAMTGSGATNKFASKAAKGVNTFAAGDEIGVETTGSGSNAKLCLKFILDTYVNVLTGDLSSGS